MPSRPRTSPQLALYPDELKTEASREMYDERAAIMEYDGGLPRRIAEARARLEVAAEIERRLAARAAGSSSRE